MTASIKQINKEGHNMASKQPTHEDLLFEQGKEIEEGRSKLFPPKDAGTVIYPLYYEVPDNEFHLRLGASIVTQPAAIGYSEPGMNTNPRVPIRCFPHKHHAGEYFVHFGIDPDNPDDLGGRVEFWVGDGADAHGFTFDKPATIFVPPRVSHLPCVFREVRKPFIHIEWLDAPIWCQGVVVPTVAPGFSIEKPLTKNTPETGKYQTCFKQRVEAELPVIPAHKGKAHIILQHSMRECDIATDFMEINMVYGSGFGWGLGDVIVYSDRQERSLPHRHNVEETYLFIGTDKQHPEDLGGTVEFWMGDGIKEWEHVINRPTFLKVPPNTIHLPLYIKEVHHAFVIASVLNMPVWGGNNTEEFPKRRQFKTRK
jgi:hypothetical protein